MDELKQEIEFLLSRSNRLYQEYLSNKVYWRARLIKHTNARIIEFLLNEGWRFDADVNTAIDHFQTWFIQFEYEEKQKTPALEDEFVFERVEGGKPYPTDVIQSILV